jgi:hypothetical protein
MAVAAEYVNLARSLAALFPECAGMFMAYRSTNGQLPITHYVASGYIPEDMVGKFPLQTWGKDESQNWVLVDNVGGDAATLFGLTQAAEIDCTQQDIEDLFLAMDITMQPGLEAWDRLGLKVIQEEV